VQKEPHGWPRYLLAGPWFETHVFRPQGTTTGTEASRFGWRLPKRTRLANTHVMNWPLGRSRGVNQASVATAEEAPGEADVAFDALYRSSRDDVYAYVASLLRDRAAAEEVTATAFERAYRKRNRFDSSRGEPRAWLFGIARNAALDELRRRGRQAELAAEPVDLAATAVDETAAESERRLAVTAALANLEPRERELIALKFFAGLTNAEIATVVGISESNAGTKLHRAVNKLREACDGAI
jgi:RNA polymerase sigma factor (sigma-70 family)